MLNINKNIADRKANIALEGRLDTVTALELENELKGSLDGVSELIMDFDKLEYISSAGLRVLLRVKKTNSQMTLTGVNSDVYEILEMTGFSEMIKVEKAYRVVSVEDKARIIGYTRMIRLHTKG